MTNRTLQRLERILVMVPWLLEHSGARVDDVAQRFNATAAELAEDLDVLGYCGLPGYGGGDLIEAYISGDRVVVRLAEYFARPLRLSVSEAVTLLLAARAVGSIEGLPESTALRRAVEKLERLLGGDAARVAVDLHAPGDELIAPLRDAIADRRVVRISYFSASTGRTRQRDVEPWAVVGYLGSWYLQGWCRDVAGQRDFRLDRINALTVLEERIPPDRRTDTAEGPGYVPSPDDSTVVLDLDASAAWVAEWVVADDVSAANGRLLVTLRTGAYEWLARLVLQLGGAARVIEPPELRARVNYLADITLRNY